jgi:hypothetical protein
MFLMLAVMQCTLYPLTRPLIWAIGSRQGRDSREAAIVVNFHPMLLLSAC